MKRLFTADLHFNHGAILEYENRPYKSAEDMNRKIINQCNSQTKDEDIVYHIGDFSNFGNNKGVPGLRLASKDLVSQLNGTWIMIEGNHDGNNKVKCHMRGCYTMVAKYRTWMSHYPSMDFYDDKWNKYMPIQKSKIDVWLCGHVHSKWKYMYDYKNKILNVNVGLDCWNYNLVPETKLIAYIDSLYKKGIQVLTDDSRAFMQVPPTEV